MVSPSRRKLLGALAAGSAGLAGGGYWLLRDDGPDCPERLESAQEFTRSSAPTWSRPVLDDGTVFVGGGSGVRGMSSETDMFRLLALDSSGEPEWVARTELAGGIGAPTPTEERVFASTGGNTLFALERSTGQFEWEVDAGNNADGYVGTETLVHDETVIAAVNEPQHDDLESEYVVVGVSADDGSIRWTADIGDEVSRGLGLVDEIVVATTQTGEVTGIDPETGDQQWQTEIEAEPDWYDKPVSFAGYAWVPRRDGVLVGLDLESGTITERLDAGRAENGDETDNGGFVQVARAIEDSLIVGDSNGTLTAYDDDLRERWSHDGAARVAAVTGWNDRIAVLDQRGIYYELENENGEFQRAFALADAGSDRCGYDPSQERLTGLAVTRQSIVATGLLFGTQLFRLPSRQ